MTGARVVRGTVGILGALLWVAAPVVLLVRSGSTGDAGTLRDAEPSWAPVQQDDDPTAVDVGLRLSWDDPAAVVAPAWTGIVEEVAVRPGDVVADGQPVAVVDGITRIAVTGRPFSRILGPGDSGPDVAALNDLLARRRLPATAGDRFTGATEDGTRALSRSLGLSPVGGFDPAWVLHLPDDGATVASVGLGPAAPVPAPGEEVVTFAPRLASATLIEPRSEMEAPPAGGEDGDEPAAPLDPGLADAPAVPLPDEADLVLDDQPLVVDDTRTEVGADALDGVRSQLAPLTPYVTARALTPAADDVWAVPSAAVITDDEGGACVVARRDGRQRVVEVDIRGGLESRTQIVPLSDAFDPDDQVEVGARRPLRCS